MEGQKAQPREHYLQKHYINKSDVEDLQILSAARLDKDVYHIVSPGETKVLIICIETRCYVQEELQDARDRILRLDVRDNPTQPQPNE